MKLRPEVCLLVLTTTFALGVLFNAVVQSLDDDVKWVQVVIGLFVLVLAVVWLLGLLTCGIDLLIGRGLVS